MKGKHKSKEQGSNDEGGEVKTNCKTKWRRPVSRRNPTTSSKGKKTSDVSSFVLVWLVFVCVLCSTIILFDYHPDHLIGWPICEKSFFN